MKNKDHEETKRSIANLTRAMTSQAEEHAHERRSKERECLQLKEKLKELSSTLESYKAGVHKLTEVENDNTLKEE